MGAGGMCWVGAWMVCMGFVCDCCLKVIRLV